MVGVQEVKGGPKGRLTLDTITKDNTIKRENLSLTK